MTKWKVEKVKISPKQYVYRIYRTIRGCNSDHSDSRQYYCNGEIFYTFDAAQIFADDLNEKEG